MTLFEKICQEYHAKSYYPIRFVTENDTHWAFFSTGTGDDFRTWVALFDKVTGEMKRGFFSDYIYLPRVPVDEKYRVPRHAMR